MAQAQPSARPGRRRQRQSWRIGDGVVDFLNPTCRICDEPALRGWKICAAHWQAKFGAQKPIGDRPGQGEQLALPDQGAA